MFSLDMKHLENCFNKAKEVGANYIGVKIRMDGFSEDEVIINPIKNVDDKLEYYKKVYDNDLNHKFSDGISIVGFTYGKSMMDIEFDLIG